MHGIEVYGDKAAIALRKDPAWHKLGEVFDDEPTTEQMLERAHLNDWNVRLRPLETDARSQEQLFEVLRDNPFDSELDRLAVVGKKYKVYQNEQLFAFGDAILDQDGLWESAGSIRGGRTVFGSLIIPSSFVLDPEGAGDAVQTFLLLNTSHDGTSAVQASVTPIRVVCQNTLNYALRGVKQSFKVRHTQKVEGRVQEAREALGLAFAYTDALETEAKALFETSVNDKEFKQIVEAVWPKNEDSKTASTRWDNRFETLLTLHNGQTSDDVEFATNKNIAGTAWSALNTLVEYGDWYRTGRGDSGEENVLEAASGFNPIYQTNKNDWHNKVLSFAKEKNVEAFV